MAKNTKGTQANAQAATEGVELTEQTKAALAAEGESVPETVVELTFTTFFHGSEAPQEVASSLAFDRIVGVSPEFLSIRRGANVRDFTARENQEYVSSLRESIETVGLKLPLDVILVQEPDETLPRIEVYRGESRLRAILEIIGAKGSAAFPTVPVRLVEREDAAAEAADYVVSNSGKNLTLLEQVVVLKRLRAAGINKPSEVGRMLGMTHTAVRNIALMEEAPETVAAEVRKGWLSATWVVEGIRKALEGKVGEDKDIAISDFEKKALKKAKENADVDKKAGRGTVQVAVEGEETGADNRASNGKPGKEPNKDNQAFNKQNFNILLDAHRKVLASMTPAKDFAKQRAMIRDVLTGMGVDLVTAEAKAAVAQAAAAQENESEPAA